MPLNRLIFIEKIPNILADFAQRQVEILEEIAEEIDERYSDIDNIRMP